MKTVAEIQIRALEDDRAEFSVKGDAGEVSALAVAAIQEIIKRLRPEEQNVLANMLAITVVFPVLGGGVDPTAPEEEGEA